MPNVLLPNYPLGQISSNFLNRSQRTSVSQFIQNNFTPLNTTTVINGAQPASNIDSTNVKLLNSILTDYGNGPISQGFNSLQLINSNVITGTQTVGDIFGNSIIYGGAIDFTMVTIQQGETIVLTNLNMNIFVNLAPTSLQSPYYAIVDLMVNDLKKGVFLATNYSAAILSQSKTIAQSVLSLYGSNI